MSGTHVNDLLTDFLDGTLSKSQLEKVRSHLVFCNACRQALAETQKNIMMLRTTPRAVPPKGLEARIRLAVRREMADLAAPAPERTRERPAVERPSRRWQFAFGGLAVTAASFLLVVLIKDMPVKPTEMTNRLGNQDKGLHYEANSKAVVDFAGVDSAGSMNKPSRDDIPVQKAKVQMAAAARKDFKEEGDVVAEGDLLSSKTAVRSVASDHALSQIRREGRSVEPVSEAFKSQRPVGRSTIFGTNETPGTGASGTTLAEGNNSKGIVDGAMARDDRSMEAKAKENAGPSGELGRLSDRALRSRAPAPANSVAGGVSASPNLVPGAPQAAGEAAPPAKPEPVMGPPSEDTPRVFEGFSSGLTAPLERVVSSQKEWSSLWRRHQANQTPKAAPPPVDFTKEQVIVLAAGNQPTGGYRLIMNEIEESNWEGSTARVVRYYLQAPPPDAIVTMAVSQPYLFKVVPRRPGSVFFRKSP